MIIDDMSGLKSGTEIDTADDKGELYFSPKRTPGVMSIFADIGMQAAHSGRSGKRIIQYHCAALLR
jgi:hypothetical protein